MSFLCDINVCKRKSFALCYCCNKKLCFNHLKEHHDLIQSQLNRLVDEINILNNQLIDSSKEAEESNNDEQKYQICNQYFSKRMNQAQENLVQLVSTISEMIYHQDATNEDIILSMLTIRFIKDEIENIKRFQISNNLPPVIKNRFKSIEQSKNIELDLSNLSIPFQSFVCKNPLGSALASNNQRLVMDQRFSLHLFDEDFILEKEIQWKKSFYT